MLFHPSSSHLIPFDANLMYFVGVFDVYDRRKPKEKSSPNTTRTTKKIENLIRKYCLDPNNRFSYRHKYKLMETLFLALNNEHFNFNYFFKDDSESYSINGLG